MEAQTLGFILQFIVLGLAVLWITMDTYKRDIDRIFYWIWALLPLPGFLFFGIVGIGVVCLGYYIWSRHYY